MSIPCMERVSSKELKKRKPRDKRQYYVLRMPIGDMKVMVPIANVETIGIRKVIGGDEVGEVFNILRQEDSPMSTNWNRRYRSNMEKSKAVIFMT